MNSESAEEIDSRLLNELSDEVEKQKQQLATIQNHIILINKRLDELLETMSSVPMPSQKLSYKIGSSLSYAAHVLTYAFILLLASSATLFAFSFSGFSELLAEFSFFCISAAEVSEVVSMLISRTRGKPASRVSSL